ncbi:MAG: hypothetical protein WC738_00470 [Candidatus Omnitrophota bacterium]
MRHKVFGITVLMLMALSVSSMGMADEAMNNKVASPEISDVINEIALFKLSILGSPGVSQINKIRLYGISTKIGHKYQINMGNLKFTVDEESGLFVTPVGIDLMAPTMTRIISSEDFSKLPEVKFKGTITLSFDTMSVKFDDKTECEVNGKEYMFKEGKWFEK